MPEPLPANTYPPESPSFHAYERCLALERSAQNAYGGDSGGKFSPQMCGHILGYMMLNASTSDGCETIRKEIEPCETDEALCDLAQFYAMYFIQIFRKAKGPTPGTSSHPSRPSFDDTQETILDLLDEASKSNSAVKKLALRRDNYLCVLTGAYDVVTFQAQRKTNPTFEVPTASRHTKTAHIFPDSLNQNLVGPDGLPGKKAEYSAIAWAVLEGFCQVNVLLESLDVHRVENVLTMCQGAHNMFDKLEIWFEATDVPNTYNVRATDEVNFKFVDPPIPHQVTLQSTNPLIPLPNPAYLRIHAACARVAHLSGAGEYLETILNELEERPVLASDGGSADMLSFLLARALPPLL